jgi:hypothetical protein
MIMRLFQIISVKLCDHEPMFDRAEDGTAIFRCHKCVGHWPYLKP